MNELELELERATDSLIVRYCAIFEKHLDVGRMTWAELSLAVDSNLADRYSTKVLVRSLLAAKYGITHHSRTSEQAGS